VASKKISLTTIANSVGVSKATVSRVLNNKANVSDKVRDEVLEAYRRKHRSLPATAQVVIGLIVPDSSNPFFSELEYAFERRLEQTVVHQADKKRGKKNTRSKCVHLITVSSEGNVKREIALGARLKDLGVKGTILIGAGDSAKSAAHIGAHGDPVLVFDRRLEVGGLDSVVVDSREGIRRAVNHLRDFGHEKIGYLRGLESTASGRERYASFIEAMAAYELCAQENWVFAGDYEVGSGRLCGKTLRELPPEERPTAILAANDLMAIGLMQDLQEHGWKLPDDLSVIGFDGIRWADWVYPRLTTVAQPIDELVDNAIRLLLLRIERPVGSALDAKVAPEIKEVTPELRLGNSVASPRASNARPGSERP